MPRFHEHRYLHSYVHRGRIGVLVEVGCDTDFLVRTPEFTQLVNDLAIQIAAMAPLDIEALLQQRYFGDSSRSVGEWLSDAAHRFQERVEVIRFVRWSTEQAEGAPESDPPRTPAVILSFRMGG